MVRQAILEFKRIFAKWRLLLRVALHLSIPAVVCFWALFHNRPREKTVKIDTPCAKLAVPISFTVNLGTSQAMLKSAVLWGAEGDISGVKSIEQRGATIVSRPQEAQFDVRASPSAATLPYLLLQPEKRRGPITLTMEKDVTLMAGDDRVDGPSLQLQSAHAGNVELSIQSERLHVEEARYLIRPPIQLTGPGDLAKFDAEAPGLFVSATFRSEPWATQPSSMEVHFLPTGHEPFLLKGEINQRPAKIDLDGGRLELGGCVDPNILIDGKKPDNVIANAELDLQLELGKFGIDELSLKRAEKRGAVLRVQGEGRAISVKQGGRQLMPTWVDEIIAEPYTTRGWHLIWLGLIALFLFKQASRALDIFWKIIIPDPPD